MSIGDTLKFRILLAALLAFFAFSLAAPSANATTHQPCSVSDVKFDKLVIGTDSATFTKVRAKPGPRCFANVSSYLVPDTWDGNGFNSTAVPQTLFDTKTVLLTHTGQDVTVALKGCGAEQVDLYVGDTIDQVGPNGHRGVFVGGRIFRTSDTCTTPSPSPTPTPTPTGSPTPTPTVSITPSRTPTPTGSITTPGSGGLPKTGEPILPVVITGLGLLFAGLGLTRLTSRRH